VASTWGWISRRREEEILRLEKKHLTHILEVAKSARSLVEELAHGDPGRVEDAYRRVKEAERAADRVKDEIIEQLSAGLFHPIDREELLRMVLVSDDIADHLNAGSRRLLLFTRAGGRVPGPVLESLREITGIAVEAVEKLIEAVEHLRRDPQRAVTLAGEVERLEEKADEARSRGEEEVIAWCDREAGPGSCIALYNALESLETATDKCEDAGDVVRSIAVLRG